MKKTKRHNREKSILEMLRDCAAQVDMWPKWKRQNREWALQQEKLLQEYLLNKYNGEDNPNPYLK